MIRQALSAVVTALAVHACAIAAAQQPQPADGSSEVVVTPILVASPEFPTEAIQRRLSGHVDVHGILGADGRLKSYSLQPDSEASRIFVPEVESVIAHWRWIDRRLNTCLPAETPLSSRVWFEWEGERQKISVQRESRVSPRKPVHGPIPERVKAVNPVYPRQMIRHGVQAQVFALAEISPEGDVISVGTVAYSEKKKNLDLGPFERAVQAAIAQWKFGPRPEGQCSHCTTVDFRIRH
jgi:outer membrane biosynthesis protein TonB